MAGHAVGSGQGGGLGPDDGVERREPGRLNAAGAFEAIAATGRQALVEMRRLLGVLRGDGDQAPSLAPQPGLAEVPSLVEQVGSADLVVVAPATADLLAKAAHGFADDLLTSTLLTAR